MWQKILVVDSEIESRGKLYEVLFAKGHEVTCVPTAKETLAILTEKTFDVIIVDPFLPDAKGKEIFESIRSFDKDVSIILLKPPRLSVEDAAQLIDTSAALDVTKDFSPDSMKAIFDFLRNQTQTIAEVSPDSLRKEKVLVVDDNEEIAKTLLIFLKKKGYNVRSASSGEDALMKIRMEKPQVAFLDFRMPGMDGVMVLRQIKRLDKDIKVVMLTSVQDEYIMEEAAREGASNYLVKPCDLEKVESILKELLKG